MSKVILVSDQPVLLVGFQQVVGTRGFEAIACDVPALPFAIQSASPPDLILMDLTAGLNFGHLTEINGRLPGCPVVLFAESMPLEMVFRALEFGVRGIVERTSSAEQLTDALRRVAGGEMQIGFAAGREATPPKRHVSLTPREREIVMFLRQGMRNKQIATEMNITEGTVKIYLFRLFQKLGVRNRFELARSNALEQVPAPTPRNGVSSGAAGLAAARMPDVARRPYAEHHPARLG